MPRRKIGKALAYRASIRADNVAGAERSTALRPRDNYCAGMVIRGRFSLPPVSPKVKKNMMAVSARFDFQSVSSIQNQ